MWRWYVLLRGHKQPPESFTCPQLREGCQVYVLQASGRSEGLPGRYDTVSGIEDGGSGKEGSEKKKDGDVLMNAEDKKILADRGWEIDCESPFEISTKDGSRATLEGAHIVLAWFQMQAENDRKAAEQDGLPF